GVTLDEYKHCTDKFNVHGLWEWTNYKVSVYELPLELYETCIDTITSKIIEQCFPVKRTNARTRANRSRKEADTSFRPMKLEVPTQTGSDRKPNIIVEVAYSESINHIFEKVKDYWLKDLSHAHDVIVVKIDLIFEDETPSRM
ncbi:1287_t:CDS:2, partial [Diversispora eburnea]